MCNPAEKLTLATTLSGHGHVGLAPGAVVTPSVAGLYVCSLVQAPCGGTFTKLACANTVGLASSQGECGIFNATGTARIASTGPLSTATATTLSTTGLTAFTLTAGTNYLVCWADSATATVSYRIVGTPTTFANTFVNTTFQSGTGATQVAPFNLACTAAATPYACCSGSGTGTCNGMADRTGVPGLTAAGVAGPPIMVAP
jgi:hypothetical protein